MSEVIDKPIEVASEVLDRAEINGDTVLVQYGKTEAALATLRTKYEGVLFDLTTTAGDKAARAGRLELVTLRTSLEKKRKEFKAPALEFGAKIDAEAKRITAEIVALETPIDAQINADEKRRADEKAERDRIEAERVAGYIARLNTMRGCVAKAQGLPSARIANGIATVEAIPVEPAAWEEFADQAATVKAETLVAMRTMFDAAKAREDEDARVEAQRVENEKVAAQQAAEAKRLKDEAAKLAADQEAAAKKLADDMAEFNRQKAEFEEKQRLAAAPAQVAAVEPEPEPAPVEPVAETIAPVEAEQPAPAVQTQELVEQPAPGVARYTSFHPVAQAEPVAVVAESNAAMIKLGDIKADIAPFDISAEGMAQLGFAFIAGKGGAKNYLLSDLPRIRAAFQQHFAKQSQLLAA